MEEYNGKKVDVTRKDFNIVLIHQDKKFFSCYFQSHSGRNPIDPSRRTMYWFRTISSVHVSRRMCSQFTFHHKFRIDTGRPEFEQQTDGIHSACGSYGQNTKILDSRLESTASCTIHADSVEETSKHGVLGRHKTCSKERI